MGTDMNIPENLIKFNVNQTGFYRVNYPDNIWQRFASRLEAVGPSAVSIGFIITSGGINFSVFNISTYQLNKTVLRNEMFEIFKIISV